MKSVDDQTKSVVSEMKRLVKERETERKIEGWMEVVLYQNGRV